MGGGFGGGVGGYIKYLLYKRTLPEGSLCCPRFSAGQGMFDVPMSILVMVDIHAPFCVADFLMLR